MRIAYCQKNPLIDFDKFFALAAGIKNSASTSEAPTILLMILLLL